MRWFSIHYVGRFEIALLFTLFSSHLLLLLYDVGFLAVRPILTCRKSCSYFLTYSMAVIGIVPPHTHVNLENENMSSTDLIYRSTGWLCSLLWPWWVRPVVVMSVWVSCLLSPAWLTGHTFSSCSALCVLYSILPTFKIHRLAELSSMAVVTGL